MKVTISDKPILSERTTKEQTIQLNELLGADEQYYSKEFIACAVFKLPSDIIYNNKRGYLSVGPLGIEYTSLNHEYKVNVVYSASTIPNKDLCDCLIKVLEFFRTNKDKIEIIEAPEDCLIEE